MSKPGIIYQSQWDTTSVDLQGLTIPAKTITVNIFDTETLIDDADDPEIIPLVPAGSPLTISNINNDENKFFQVRSKQAVIRFLSNTAQGLDITTFSDSSDNRWYVEITHGSDFLFKGFLMLSDMQEPFYPDPVICELTASDHLGILKDAALVDDAGANPIGKYRIAEFLSFALNKTGLSLPIHVVNNLKHGSGKVLNITADFVASANTITIVGDFSFFYIGQEIIVTDTASNNKTFIVSAIQPFFVGQLITLSGDTVADENNTASFEDKSSTGHFYDKMYLDAKTFESEIGVCENCYSVLEKILGQDCYITQWQGEWWIIRIDELQTGIIYPAKFLANGDFDSYEATFDPTREVGDGKSIVHAQASTLLRMSRPYLFAKETYRYNNPQEIPCNIDFSRGTGPAPSGASSETIDYTLDCWNFLREGTPTADGNFDHAPETGSVGVLRKLFEYGYEKDRYLVTQTAGGFRHFFKSEAILIQQGDKFTFGINYKYNTDLGAVRSSIAHIRIVGDDGKVYDWNYDTLSGSNSWVQKNPTDTVFDSEVSDDITGIDTSVWKSFSGECPPAPAPGNMYIRLLDDLSASNIKYFQSLSLNLIPLINGSYRRYLGHYNKVTRDPAAGFNANIDEEVFVGDSPRKTFKGAMFFLRSLDGVYILSRQFWSSAPFALGSPPGLDFIHPYGFIQAYSVWNQYRRALRIFEATMYGLFDDGMPDRWPDLVNTYTLTDTNTNTVNRVFLMVSFQQDYKTCLWTGVFVEVFNTDGKIYSDPLEFKYITQ